MLPKGAGCGGWLDSTRDWEMIVPTGCTSGPPIPARLPSSGPANVARLCRENLQSHRTCPRPSPDHPEGDSGGPATARTEPGHVVVLAAVAAVDLEEHGERVRDAVQSDRRHCLTLHSGGGDG